MPARVKDVRPREGAASSSGAYPDWPVLARSNALSCADGKPSPSAPTNPSTTAARTEPPIQSSTSAILPAQRHSSPPRCLSIAFPRKQEPPPRTPNPLSDHTLPSTSRSTIEAQSRLIDALKAEKQVTREALTSCKGEIARQQQAATETTADLDASLRREKGLKAIMERATVRERENTKALTDDLEKWKGEMLVLVGQEMAKLMDGVVRPIMEKCTELYEHNDNLMWARERAVGDAEKDRKVTGGKVDDMKKRVDKMEANISAILQKEKKIDEAVETSKGHMSKVHKRLDALEGRPMPDSRGAKEALLAIKSTLSAFQDKVNTEISTATDARLTLERELKDVQEGIKAVKVDGDNARIAFERQISDCVQGSATTASVDEVMARIAILEEGSTRLKERIDHETNSRLPLRREFDASQVQIKKEKVKRLTLENRIELLQDGLDSLETNGTEAQLAWEAKLNTFEDKVKGTSDEGNNIRTAINGRLESLEKMVEQIDAGKKAQLSLETQLKSIQDELELVNTEIQTSQCPVSRLESVESGLKQVLQLLDLTSLKFTQSTDNMTRSDNKIRRLLASVVTWAQTVTQALQFEVVTNDQEHIHISVLEPQMEVLNSWTTHLAKSQRLSENRSSFARTIHCCEKIDDQAEDATSNTRLHLTSNHDGQQIAFVGNNGHSTPPTTLTTATKSITQAQTSHEENPPDMVPSTDSSQQQLPDETVQSTTPAKLLALKAPLEVLAHANSPAAPTRTAGLDIENDSLPPNSRDCDDSTANAAKAFSSPTVSDEPPQKSADVHELQPTEQVDKSVDSRKRPSDQSWLYDPQEKALKRLKVLRTDSDILKLRVPSLRRTLEKTSKCDEAVVVAKSPVKS